MILQCRIDHHHLDEEEWHDFVWVHDERNECDHGIRIPYHTMPKILCTENASSAVVHGGARTFELLFPQNQQNCRGISEEDRSDIDVMLCYVMLCS